MLGEVRDTLSDLRTEVSDQRGLVDTLEAYLDRVAARTDFEVDFRHDSHRPAAPRPGAGAVADRPGGDHQRRAPRPRPATSGSAGSATATRPTSPWPTTARGFPRQAPRRADSFGLTGMQERANAIGATLQVESEPYVGTLVECRVDAPVAAPPTRACARTPRPCDAPAARPRP